MNAYAHQELQGPSIRRLFFGQIEDSSEVVWRSMKKVQLQDGLKNIEEKVIELVVGKLMERRNQVCDNRTSSLSELEVIFQQRKVCLCAARSPT